ncbi:MAG: thermonuclease family protein [Bacteroidetes bacterium]|nr:thermonuclease family protein [Bacteroidota bacterium]MBS1541001.1 thermonuclease family protein [Bacteroidota bacterium]
MKNIAILVVLVMVTVGGFCKSNVVNGKVVTVIDGNTVSVTGPDNETYRVVLYGIDCPEIGQEFGEQAKSFLSKMILDKNVSVQMQGKDRWGNYVGIILIDETLDPRFSLLEAGLAWTTERNPVEELVAIKEKARAKGTGLWKLPDPTPPWIFRRQQTLTQYKSS